MKKLVSAAVLTGTLLLSGGVASAQYASSTTVPEVLPNTVVRNTSTTAATKVATEVAAGGLARTGNETLPMVAGGAALVAVGGAFVVAARRRSAADAS